ncbi:MAG: hypothetical protein ACYDD1_06815 [Caulobacteraceae bacterium]
MMGRSKNSPDKAAGQVKDNAGAARGREAVGDPHEPVKWFRRSPGIVSVSFAYEPSDCALIAQDMREGWGGDWVFTLANGQTVTARPRRLLCKS